MWRMMSWCVRSIRKRRLIYTVWPAPFPLVPYVKCLGVISPVRLLHSNLSTRPRKWDFFCLSFGFSYYHLSAPLYSLSHDDWSFYISVIVCADRVVWWRCCVGWQQWQNSGHHQSARGKLQICGGQCLCVLSLSMTDPFFVDQFHCIITLRLISYITVLVIMPVHVCLCRKMAVGRSLVYASGLIVCTLFWKSAEETSH